MPKIIFINRFFYPDHSATSQLLSDLVFELGVSLDSVSVITSRMKYDDPSISLSAYEAVNNVAVHRVQTSRFGRDTYRGRARDYLSFYLKASCKLWNIIEKGDVVIVKTDPPVLSIIIACIVKIRKGILVNWLQDLFPEVAVELNVKYIKGLLEKFFMILRNWSLKMAKYNVAIGSLMAERLSVIGVDKESIRVIHNWSDGKAIYPLDSQHNKLRSDWYLQNKFVVGYSGNFGQAHEFNTLLQAMSELRSDDDIVFLFIGAGTQLKLFVNACRQKSICNVIFKPYQPRSLLHYSLATPDAHIATLRPNLEGLIVPSKFYGIAASGRPTLFIGHPDGEIATVIKNEKAGYVIEPGDYRTLVSSIRTLKRDQRLRQQFGSNARSVFEQRFDKSVSFKAWKELLADCGIQFG